MNADTSSLHLDLGDLIAEAAGQPVGDRARQHLAGCETASSRRTGGTSWPKGSAAWPMLSRRQLSRPGRGTPCGASWRVPGGAPCWPARPPRSS